MLKSKVTSLNSTIRKTRLIYHKENEIEDKDDINYLKLYNSVINENLLLRK